MTPKTERPTKITAAAPALRTSTPATGGIDAPTSTTRKQPTRLLLYALPGWGKTSFAAQAPSPVFLMTRGETGLEMLIDAGELPETPHFPSDFQTFNEMMGGVDFLVDKPHDFKTCVIDTANGAARLAAEEICRSQYGSSWKDFEDFGRGWKPTGPRFCMLLDRLDQLRAKRGMSVILLAHAQTKTTPNPEGGDYLKYTPDLAPSIWSPLDRWCDAILFGRYEVFVDKEGQKHKARGLGHRIMQTSCRATFDAKNRFGLPEEIDGGDNAADCWANFIAAMKQGKPAA